MVESGGGTCTGLDIDLETKTDRKQEACNGDTECPAPVIDCTWNAWGPYSDCSVSCGEGTKTKSRTKSVVESGGGTCSGKSQQDISCFKPACTTPGINLN